MWYLVENPLQARIALSLALMDISRDWVSSLWCFARSLLQLTSVVVCFYFCLQRVKCSSIGFRSGEWLGHCRIIHLFTFKNSWVAFPVCFGSLSICTIKHRTISFVLFGWICTESITLYTSEFIRLFLSFCHIITKQPRATGSHAAHASHCSTVLHRGCCMLWSRAVPSLLHTFFFPSFWYRWILISAVQTMLFKKCSGFLDVFCQSVIWPCLLCTWL